MAIQIAQVKCQKCGHVWAPRIVDPQKCPRCQSTRWNENGAKS